MNNLLKQISDYFLIKNTSVLLFIIILIMGFFGGF